MNNEQRVVFIQSQCVCAMAEIEAMKAANKERELSGLSLAYGEKDFLYVLKTYMVEHNSVIEYLRDDL